MRHPISVASVEPDAAAVSARAATPLLRVRDLTLTFGADDAPVVDQLDLDVRPGETFALVGESGSGKSLTASAVIGLLPTGARVVRGRVELDGTDLLDAGRPTGIAFRGSRIGMVFQNPMTSLDPSFRIGNQLDEVIGLHHPALTRRARAELAATWLGEVGIDDARRVLASYPHELSGGMRQRVMIALAALSEPSLLIADEPTTALDSVVQKQILDLLVRVTRTTGSSLLLITHDFGVVNHVADRVAVMRHGRIVETGTREQVLLRPRVAYTRQLIGAVPRFSRAGRVPRDAGEALVRLSGVRKEYALGGLGTVHRRRHVLAVDDVTLDVRRGETLGLIGASGSGKSTLARLVGALQPVSAGSVTFDGHDLTALGGRGLRALRPRFQFVFQDATSSLNPRLRIGEQVARPLRRFGIAGTRDEAASLVEQALVTVGLPAAFADRFPHQLSGGQRQRVGIARAVALRPDLLVLDEPTSALDVSTQAEIVALLRGLRDELGLTCLFIGHDLALVQSVSDRIAVMDTGRLVEVFDADDLAAPGRHRVTRRLLDAVLAVPDHELGRHPVPTHPIDQEVAS